MRSEDRPALLVSVRSVEEAFAAVAGGCDVLDVKEPRRGSLGAADPAVIAAICDANTAGLEPRPISAALGELNEWADRPDIPTLPPGVTFAKLGLSHCRQDTEWVSRWRELRRRFDEAAGRPLSWIAVAYADPAADAPRPETLIDHAAATGCRGLLIDTFAKDDGRLFDHVAAERLAAWRRATTAAGLLLAVAGSVRVDDLPGLAEFRPDVIAVRGAACRNGDRTGSIATREVARLVRAVKGSGDGVKG